MNFFIFGLTELTFISWIDSPFNLFSFIDKLWGYVFYFRKYNKNAIKKLYKLTYFGVCLWSLSFLSCNIFCVNIVTVEPVNKLFYIILLSETSKMFNWRYLENGQRYAKSDEIWEIIILKDSPLIFILTFPLLYVTQGNNIHRAAWMHSREVAWDRTVRPGVYLETDLFLWFYRRLRIIDVQRNVFFQRLFGGSIILPKCTFPYTGYLRARCSHSLECQNNELKDSLLLRWLMIRNVAVILITLTITVERTLKLFLVYSCSVLPVIRASCRDLFAPRGDELCSRTRTSQVHVYPKISFVSIRCYVRGHWSHSSRLHLRSTDKYFQKIRDY